MWGQWITEKSQIEANLNSWNSLPWKLVHIAQKKWENTHNSLVFENGQWRTLARLLFRIESTRNTLSSNASTTYTVTCNYVNIKFGQMVVTFIWNIYQMRSKYQTWQISYCWRHIALPTLPEVPIKFPKLWVWVWGVNV